MRSPCCLCLSGSLCVCVSLLIFIFYAGHVVSKEIRRLVIPRISCGLIIFVTDFPVDPRNLSHMDDDVDAYNLFWSLVIIFNTGSSSCMIYAYIKFTAYCKYFTLEELQKFYFKLDILTYLFLEKLNFISSFPLSSSLFLCETCAWVYYSFKERISSK
jgi:hypothetical protein